MGDLMNPTGANSPDQPQGTEQPAQAPNNQQEPEETVPKVEFDAAQQKIASLEKQLETLTNTLMNPEYLSVLRGGAQPQPAAPPPEQPEQEPNFEEMKPKEVVDYIVKKVTQTISPKIEEVSTTADVVRARQEINDCMAKYPDFLLYKDAMIQIGKEKEKQGIQISAEDAYFIAKGKAQLALAQKPAPKPATSTSTAAPKPKPTEKPGIPSDATSRTSLSAKEAGERAFAQIFGS